ncbi:MAG: lipoyl synthase [Kiritimatiellaeota bacterium]|nr:lipoyl synthase [Kiritimatiellota bacterium]
MEPPVQQHGPQRLPPWLRTRLGAGAGRRDVRRLLTELRLHTVCMSACCPNLGECWERRAATFLILGNVCTRSCRFCAIPNGAPSPPDPDEPERLAEAASRLVLRFVVVTSVTRDDLADGGASQFAATIRTLRARLPGVGIEVLTPDFRGRSRSIETVVREAPTVFNHNIETCARLTGTVRSEADYRRSLAVLETASRLGAGKVLIKSGLMLGLGETPDEIRAVFADLRNAGVEILTIGQYLPPTESHWPVDRFVPPDEFEEWGCEARETFGFRYVASAPQVRSSYAAEEAVRAVRAGAKRPR